MLRVHLADGKTMSWDITADGQLDELLERLRSQTFQKSITAITVQMNGHPCTMSRPKRAKDIEITAQRIEPNGKVKGGVRLTCQFDDARTVIMAHANGAVKVVTDKVGWQKFNPVLEG